jgi:uncharacterized FlaG/YvyC family protein
MESVPAISMVVPIAGSGSFPSVDARRHTTTAAHVVKAQERTEIKADTEKAVAELSKAMEPFDIALRFSKDDETGTIVVQMIDQKSGEAVQQIPTEASLRIAALITKFQGRIFSRKA